MTSMFRYLFSWSATTWPMVTKVGMVAASKGGLEPIGISGLSQQRLGRVYIFLELLAVGVNPGSRHLELLFTGEIEVAVRKEGSANGPAAYDGNILLAVHRQADGLPHTGVAPRLLVGVEYHETGWSRWGR